MDKLIAAIVAAMVTTFGVIIIANVFGLILAWPIKWTWNATMPYLFTLPTITWGKAWCLNFLCACLIKSTVAKK